jgi:hypothetical protein
MYVRPLAACFYNGDGTSYRCASSNGGEGAYRAFGNVVWGAGAGKVSDGDTLYICGFHDAGHFEAPQDGSLTPKTNAVLDGGCPGDHGSLMSSYRTIRKGWIGPDMYGAYRQSVDGDSTMHIAQLVKGVPTRLPSRKVTGPDGTWKDGAYYHDTAAKMLYVKPLGGIPANGTSIYTTWSAGFNIQNVAVTIQNLTYYGLSTDHCVRLARASHTIVQNNIIKWCLFAAIEILSDSDDVVIRRNDVSESGNGVYVESGSNADNSDRLVVEFNTFHDLDQDGYYGDLTFDNHAIGIQGGDGGQYRSNIIRNVAGSCVTLFSFPNQSQKNNMIAWNECRDIRYTGSVPLTVNKRLNRGIEYQNINIGHVPDDTVGNTVFGNVLVDVKNDCLFNKSQQPLAGNPWKWVNNTLVNCGIGYTFLEDADGDTGFLFANNLLYNSGQHVAHITGSDYLGNILFKNNLYYPDGTRKFGFKGKLSDFVGWKGMTGQDIASMSRDPKLMSDSDPHLAADSPARRKGIVWGSGCADDKGQPCLVPPDIGAFQEYDGEPDADTISPGVPADVRVR